VRGGRFRLAALQVGQVGVGTLEAADPDAGQRVVLGDLNPLAHELAPASRGTVQAPPVAEDVVADVGDGESSDGDDHRGYGRDRDSAAPPGEDRGQHDSRDERREARLRVREQEPRPDRRNRRGPPDQQAPIAREEHRNQAREDRHDEEAPVDRRVPEHRVDAVERGVGVPDLDLGVPEDLAGLVLVDPDRREDEGQCGHLDEQAERPEPPPLEPRQCDREQAEREVEEEQVDRPLAQVAGPEDREAEPGDERRERPGDDAELLPPRVPAPELPGQQERGGRDDAVEGNEQVRFGRPDGDVDPRRNAGQRHERQQPRPAPEERRSARRERKAQNRGREQQRPVALGREVDRQQQHPERPGGEPGEALEPGRSDEQDGQPGGAEHAARAGQLGGHGLTTTSARET